MKLKSRETAVDYISVILGPFFLAIGINMFLAPNKISAGGVGSLATILLYTAHIPLSVTYLVCNAALFVIGYRLLGRSSVVKTAVGMALSSLFFELTGGFMQYTDDVMLASVFGGILVGIGVGVMIRREASTGGSDFAALMLNHAFPHISIAIFIMIIDCAIIAVSGIVFKSLTVMFYSAVSLYVSTIVADRIYTVGNTSKLMLISSKKNDEISRCIMERFERGTTGIYSKGLYTGTDSMMVMCVTTPKELPTVMHAVRAIDADSFITVLDAKEVFGNGFTMKSNYDNIG